jgi:geranylgeranyl diphosphate synthase type II
MSINLEPIYQTLEEAIQGLPYPDHPNLLYDPVKYTLSDPGKRIRSKLTLLGAALTGGDPLKAIPAGVAIELLHNFTLIHDDIMDNADTRRGKMTVYRKWGVPTAILSGDILFGLSYQQLNVYAEKGWLTTSEFAMLLSTFHQAVTAVCEGQAMDIEFEQSDVVHMDTYIEMIRKKTAALLSAALELGGIATHANQEMRSHLNAMGTAAGIAFQIQDDLMDVVADPSTFGKKVGGDIREGKKTWLMIRALESADEQQAAMLRQICTSKSANDIQIQQVIRLYENLGILHDAQKEIERYYREAMEHLLVFKDAPQYHYTRTFFDALLNRSS